MDIFATILHLKNSPEEESEREKERGREGERGSRESVRVSLPPSPL